MNNDNNSTGSRQYTDWTSNRSGTNQRLGKTPPITNTADGKRYYSAIDGELYFGDIFVDEVTSIAWSIQQQTMPIFGYNSYTFDDIAVGSRLIQGQFAINFTERNFLQYLQDNTSAFRKISRKMYADDLGSSTSFTDFRKRLHLPMWDKGFDIVIGFGSNNGKMKSSSDKYSTFLVLGCVQITGSSIQLDYNGEPVQEVYSFIARDIKEAYSDNAEQRAYSGLQESKNKTEVDMSNSNISLEGLINLTSTTENIIVTTNSDVKLNTGSVQLSGNFNNKTLSTVMNLVTDSNKKLYTSVSQDFLNTFKKECSEKNTILGTVSYTYIKNNSDEKITEEATIEFTIKK